MKSLRRHLPFAKYLKAVHRLRIGQIPVWIEYPIDFKPRWRDAPGHLHLSSTIAAATQVMQRNLDELAEFAPTVESINRRRWPELAELDWMNHHMPALDALSLMWAATRAKQTYMEIGSGNSTLFVKAALMETGTPTRIVSIDPSPRADCDAICDEVIRQKVEDIDLSVFDRLEAGDTLFIDNSHRSFMNSDVTVCMIEIIPRLKSGVRVGIHDIFLPYDYLEHWDERGYNEQYLLACYLLANPEYFDIQLANHWMFRQGMHREPLAGIWSQLGKKVRDRAPSAFWAVKR